MSINPHSLNHPNDGFTVVYLLTPAEVCVRLDIGGAQKLLHVWIKQAEALGLL